MIKRIAFGLLLFLAFPTTSLAQSAIECDIISLTFQVDNRLLPLRVWLAETPQQRMRGMMFQSNFGQADGMLFDFQTSEEVHMWMKNTSLALDMVFIDRNGHIVKLHNHAKPYSESIIASGKPVRYVLELPAGEINRLGLSLASQMMRP